MGAYRKDIRVFFPAHTLGKRHTNHIKKKNAMPMLPYNTAGKTLKHSTFTPSLWGNGKSDYLKAIMNT